MTSRCHTFLFVLATMVGSLCLTSGASAEPPIVADKVLNGHADLNANAVFRPIDENGQAVESLQEGIVPGPVRLRDLGGFGRIPSLANPNGNQNGNQNPNHPNGQPAGGGGPNNPPQNPPAGANPDWKDIIGGLGGILGAGQGQPVHRPGWSRPGVHHPGHSHGGHSSRYYPVPSGSQSSSGYVPSNPLPSASARPGTGVIVSNPATNDAAISFVVGGRNYVLDPGYQQVLAKGRPITIRFDRGGSYGTAQYTLESGIFEFTVADQGWNLYRKIFRVALDNRANDFDFRYLVGGRVHMVEANSLREYKMTTPLTVTFDAGTGQATERTLGTGSYEIAIHPETHVWDLLKTAETPDVSAPALPPSPPLPISE